MTIPKTKFDYDIEIDFRDEALTAVGAPPPTENAENNQAMVSQNGSAIMDSHKRRRAWRRDINALVYDISFRAGSSEWNTQNTDKEHVPHCEVGGFDDHNGVSNLDDVVDATFEPVSGP